MQKLTNRVIADTCKGLSLEQKAALSVTHEVYGRLAEMRAIDKTINPVDFVAYMNILLKLKVSLMNWIAHYFRTIIIIGRDNNSITELHEHIDEMKKLETMGLSRELIMKVGGITAFPDRPI